MATVRMADYLRREIVKKFEELYDKSNPVKEISTHVGDKVYDIFLGSKINGFMEMHIGTMVPSTGCIKHFNIHPYEHGLWLQFPVYEKKSIKMKKLKRIGKLSKAFLETRDWYKLLKL